jgi:hypothetical protein
MYSFYLKRYYRYNIFTSNIFLGIGDTIRVSLTEKPEAAIEKLIDMIKEDGRWIER